MHFKLDVGKIFCNEKEMQVDKKIVELSFRILGDSPDLYNMAHRLEWLMFHFPQAKLEAAFRWLIRNRLTGKAFLDFVAYECASSNLELQRILLMKLEQTTDYKRLHALKDFRQ